VGVKVHITNVKTDVWCDVGKDDNLFKELWMLKFKTFARIEIDESRCKGCGLCTITCPIKLLKLKDEINDAGHTPAVIESQDKCGGCALCAGICPDIAIKVYSRQMNIFTGMNLLDRLHRKNKTRLPK
jgi:2-oxoglutarate ferredoxin oxidoreductase subunit delta